VIVCVLGSDLMWFQHILMSNSWTSRCPSSPSFLVGRCGHFVFVWCLVGVTGVLQRGGIFFFHVMVGGDGGVVGPKELVGWVGTVTDSRVYTPPTPRFTEVES
jgi:hypothetical protein